MSLHIVTGLPGTGKSTLYTELKRRGHTAYDGDIDGLAHWYNDSTGEIAEIEVVGRTPEFLQAHSRNIPREAVQRLAVQAIDRPVFLCGDPENETELQDLLTGGRFALVLDEEALREERLSSRTDNNWGQLSHERAYDLVQKDIAYERYQRFGYITINAAQPIDVIADFVLANAT